MKRLIAFISILMLASIVSGTATSITIYGTNRSNANSNITCNGCNNSIYVNAWNTSYVKNITVNSSNASGDVISFNISNVTAYQVQELKVNKTAINAYQAGANGMLNFSYNVTGNKTLELSPARKIDGYNFTWAYIWNTLPNASIPLSALNKTKNDSVVGDICFDTGKVLGVGLDCTTVNSVNRLAIGSSIHALERSGSYYGWADDATYVSFSQGFSWNGTAVLLTLASGADFYVGSTGAGNDVFANAFNQYSSEKYKKNIQNLSLEDEKISRFVRYQTNTDKFQYGVIAEEEQDIATTQWSNELQMNVTAIDIVSLFVRNMQAMKNINNRQEIRIKELEAKVIVPAGYEEIELKAEQSIIDPTQTIISGLTGAGAAYLLVRRKKAA